MDLRVIFVAAGLVACALTLKALASSWQRARTIDVGGVSSAWLVEQRVDRNPDNYS
jgi:hypothetical protein